MTSSTRTLRIVISDDEVDIRDYFAALLPRLGHELVGAASNGRELVQLCADEKPDLVITDVMMPELDGLAAATLINQDHCIPVIILSSHEPPEIVADEPGLIQDCIVDYLVKPVDITDLEQAINRARAAQD